jgi:hypothetical protein
MRSEVQNAIAAAHEYESGPSPPIIDIGFDGEFGRQCGFVVLTSSFVEIDPKATFGALRPPLRFRNVSYGAWAAELTTSLAHTLSSRSLIIDMRETLLKR